jgi:arsenate reductase
MRGFLSAGAENPLIAGEERRAPVLGEARPHGDGCRAALPGQLASIGGMKVFHYPGCSTCKAALKWLDARGIEYERVHIVEHPPSVAQLDRARELSGQPLKKLFNTAGQSYRAGGFKDRLADMADEEALAALAADGMLVKRPLLLDEGRALIGFKQAEWKAALE